MFKSAVSCPGTIKYAVGKQHFTRARKNSSSPAQACESLDMTKKLLRSNNYPEAIIEEISHKSCHTAQRREPYMKRDDAILKLPFRSEDIQRKAKHLVERSGFLVNVVSEHTLNLKDALVKSALNPSKCSIIQEGARHGEQRRRGRPLNPCISCSSGLPSSMCDSPGIIYMMKCALCRKRYAGETLRVARVRFEEHHYEASHRMLDKPWGKHMAPDHQQHGAIKRTDVIFIEAQELAVKTRMNRRKLRESIEIRGCRPAINISFGWPLKALAP